MVTVNGFWRRVPLLLAVVTAALLIALWRIPHAPGGPIVGPVAPTASTPPASASGDTGPLLVAAGLASTGADGVIRVDGAAVSAALATLSTSTTVAGTYNRDDFGQAWADIDRNGCDTRNDMLRRDLADVQLKPATHDCVVLTGTLSDPYTGQTIAFMRGERTSTAVQIDHIWPLGLAWDHGAAGWTPQQREDFANDPVELLAVDGRANESKSDAGPGRWLPPSIEYRCAYVARFTYIAVKYSLTIAAVDRDAISGAIAHCP